MPDNNWTPTAPPAGRDFNTAVSNTEPKPEPAPDVAYDPDFGICTKADVERLEAKRMQPQAPNLTLTPGGTYQETVDKQVRQEDAIREGYQRLRLARASHTLRKDFDRSK